MTKVATEAGRVIGIQLVDHVIVGKDRFFSYADRGLI